MNGVPDRFYRLSIKGLILNEAREKFLIVQEDNGLWELPGGGLDWGESPRVGLKREIKEEMGLDTTWISQTPCYLLVGQKKKDGIWIANVLFEVKVNNLDFVSSEECIAIKFVSASDVQGMDTFPNVQEFAKMFNPANHRNL